MPSSSLSPLICSSRQLLKKLCLLAHPSLHRHQPWHTSRPCSMPFSFLLSVYAPPKSILVLLQSLLQISPSVIFSKCKSSHPTTVTKIWLLQEKLKVPKLPHRVWLSLASLSVIHGTRNPMTCLRALHLLQIFESSFLSWDDPSVYLLLHLLVSIVASLLLLWSNPWSPTTSECDYVWRDSFLKRKFGKNRML